MSLSITSNLSLLVDCESTTNWSGDGTLTTDASFKKQGTYGVGVNVDIETLTVKCDLASERGSNQNLTNVVIYFWANHILPPAMDSWANGGLRLYLEDSAGNYSEWYVAGNDSYEGGWRRFAVDTATTPDAVSGTLNLASVQYIGLTIKDTVKFKAPEEIYFDYFVYHANNTYAYTVTGGASAPRDFAELASQDAATGYGIFVENLEKGLYYQVGPIRFNDTGTSSLTFADSNQIITTYGTYRSFTTGNRGSAESLVATGQYDWTVTGNATGTTSFTLGSKSGNEGITGCVFKQGSTNDPLMTFDATNTNVNTFKIYGCTFIDIGTFKTPASSANREVLSTTFSGCGTITPDTCKFEYCTIVSSTGVALDLSSTSHNVAYCKFINAGTYAIEVSAVGTYSLTDVTVAGSTTADIENSNNATTTDSYSESNYDTDQQLYSGGTEGVGQSITGDGNKLTSITLYLRKVGTPTGNAVVKLYTHSGTFGTSSVPTTPLLATSKNLDVTTLGASYALVKIDFDDSEFYTLVNGTKYVITLEYAGGGASNRVEAGYDASTPGHGGNKSTYNGTVWSAQSGDDLCFYARTGGDVTINANGTSNPTTYANTGTPAGVTNINATVTFKITGLPNNTEVTLIKDSDSSELDHIENTSGDYTYQYNYTGDIAAHAHLNHIDYVWKRVSNITLGSSDQIIPIELSTDRVYDNPT